MISSSGARFFMSPAYLALTSRFGRSSIHRRPTRLLDVRLVETRTGRAGGQPDRVVVEEAFHLHVQSPERFHAEYVVAPSSDDLNRKLWRVQRAERPIPRSRRRPYSAWPPSPLANRDRPRQLYSAAFE